MQSFLGLQAPMLYLFSYIFSFTIRCCLLKNNSLPWESILKFWQHKLQRIWEKLKTFQGYPNADNCILGTKHTYFNFWRFVKVNSKDIKKDARDNYKAFERYKWKFEPNSNWPKCWYLYPWHHRYKFQILGDSLGSI